jgi:hypothetical protein
MCPQIWSSIFIRLQSIMSKVTEHFMK